MVSNVKKILNFKKILTYSLIMIAMVIATIVVIPYTYGTISYLRIECNPQSMFYQEINALYFDRIKGETMIFLDRNQEKTGAIRLDLSASNIVVINYQSNSLFNLNSLIEDYEKEIQKKFNIYKNEIMIGKLNLNSKLRNEGFFKLLGENPYFKIAYQCDLTKLNDTNIIVHNKNRYYLFFYFAFIALLLIVYFKKLIKDHRG
jgi:hypothetical protein